MKKLLSLIAIAVLGASVTFAQTAPAAKKVATVKATAPVAVKKAETKVATVKTTAAVKKETKKVVTVATPTKKDGTADMRYKVNKEAKTVVAGPTKKDGTADMRYKANKAAAKKN